MLEKRKILPICQLKVKIIYLAQLNYGSTAGHRGWALERIGHQLVNISTDTPGDIFRRVLNKGSKYLFNTYSQTNAKNKSFLSAINEIEETDCVWVDKGILVAPKTILYMKNKYPHAVFIHYSPDDMLNKQNQTREYLSSIPLYDLHVTTKSYNVEELKQIGAKDVLFVDNAFEPTVHKKMPLDQAELKKYGSSVSFIGAFEKERAESIEFLAQKGIKIKVWGRSWYKKINSPNISVVPQELFGEAYSKVLNATDINLCFLRKVNRDLQTTRSIEIPACGGFMLAERTAEHQRLFNEGVEADFFSSDQELLEKVIFYEEHSSARQRIAAAGHQKCLDGPYSNDSRMAQVFQYIHQ